MQKTIRAFFNADTNCYLLFHQDIIQLQQKMDNSSLLILLKILVMVLFFLIVVMVGSLPIRSKNFKRRPLIRAIGATFAGALFINVSIMHILPESADALQEYLRESQKKEQEEEVFPLAYLFLMVGFLVTVFFTKVISFHSHEEDHFEEETQNTSSSSEDDNSPKKELIRDEGVGEIAQEEEKTIEASQTKRKEVKTIEPPPRNKDRGEGQGLRESLTSRSNSYEDGHGHGHGHHLENPSMLNEAYILTIAIYFHTIFQGIAIGVQNSITGFLSTAVAIAFHKWADALSMGCHYKTKNVKKQTAYGLIIGQAVLNVLSIGTGWLIASQGQVVEAIFLSISAGTFLAISTLQMLGEQLHHKQYMWIKFALMVGSTGFVAAIWFFENSIFGD